MQHIFGAGSLWGLRTDASGVFTPQKFGVLQEVQFDFTRTVKELFGSYQMPIAIGAGTMKPTAKAKLARIMIQPYADLYFGLSSTSGQHLIAEDEAGTIGTTPFTVTSTNAATFSEDLGVFFAATGLPLTRAAAASTTGTYSVSATTGVYTFSSYDTGLGVTLNYKYTTTSGRTLTMTNQLLGVTPTFQAVFKGTFGGKQCTLTLPNCVSSKLTLPTKLEDFSVQELDFSIFVDASNNLGTLTMAE